MKKRTLTFQQIYREGTSMLKEPGIREAALDAGVTLRQIEARQQAPDHPILPEVPETDYLKFYLLQVV